MISKWPGRGSLIGSAIEAGTGKRFGQFLVVPAETSLFHPLDDLRRQIPTSLEQGVEQRKIAPSETFQGVFKSRVIL